MDTAMYEQTQNMWDFCYHSSSAVRYISEGYIPIRVIDLSLPLTGRNLLENDSCTSPEQLSRAGPGGIDVNELV